MKTLFIPGKSRKKIDETKIRELSNEIPREIAIVYSIQFKEQAYEIKKILSENHKIILISQILGCTSPKFPNSTKAILFVGFGRFHPVSVASKTKIQVYNLERNIFDRIKDSEIKEIETMKKTAYLKFLSSNNSGIIVSVKPGQENLKKAIILKKKLKNKKNYIFISDSINLQETENFPDIESWINTACPRLDFDKKDIMNIEDLKGKK